MANSFKELEKRVTAEIESMALAMSKTIDNLEGRFTEIEQDHLIMKKHYMNLSNRFNYLEKRITKKK